MAGESLACWFLASHGLRVIARNVRVVGGEIDLLAVDGKTRVAVEVRLTTGDDDPIDRLDSRKRRHVVSIARRAGAQRVDGLGLLVSSRGFDAHWLPGLMF